MGFDAFFPQMYVVTQNELLWATYHWEAIAVSISSCWWWLFTFGTICPRSCLLSCSVVVLGCLPWDRHLRSSAPGCQSLVAGRKPLLASGDWSSLGKHLGHGRQRLDGWRSRRPGDVGMLHWGIVWVQKKGKRITRWKTIASKGMGTWGTGRSLLPIAPYLMCFHSRDMSSAWAVWNLWVVFQVNLERQQLPPGYLQSSFDCSSPHPCCVLNAANRNRRMKAKKEGFSSKGRGSRSEVVERVIEF